MVYLKTSNLTKIYRKHDNGIDGIENVNMELKSGEVTVILGPNGSGKSTFIKMLCSEF